MSMPNESTLIVIVLLVGGFWLARKAIRRISGVARLALMAVLAVVGIMTFGPFVGNAFAAETTPPVLACGATVEWSLTPTVGTPANAATALQSAWSQIADATGAHGKKVNEASLFGNDGGKISWYWRYPMDGGVGADPIDEDNSAITEVTHQHVGDLAGTVVALPLLTQMMLRDLGRDFELPVAIQGTGGKLTKADKAAFKAACNTPATSTAPAGSTVTSAPDGVGVADDARPATAQTPPTSHTVSDGDKTLSNLMLAGGVGVFVLTLFGGRLRKFMPGWVRVPASSGIKGLPGRFWARVTGFRKGTARDKTNSPSGQKASTS